MNQPTRILIVEDLAADVDLATRAIRKVLQDCEFQVVETRSDFLQALEVFQPDVILSDYSLPHFDGMKALQLALEHAPLTPLIIWTGSIGEDVAVACMKAGANNYVIKENLKRLGPAVIHALEEREVLVARRQAEEKYRAIFENSVEGVFQSSLEGRYIHVNAAMARIYGYDCPQEMVETVKSIADQIYAESPRRDEFVKSLHSRGTVENFEQRNYRKDGSVIWTSTSARLVRDPNGNVLYYEGFVSDITARKRAEESLKERERQLMLLFSNLPGPVYRCRNDADYTVEFVSDGITALSGYQAEDFRQHRRHFGRMVHPADRERVWNEVQTAVTGNQPFELTYRILTVTGEQKWVWEKGQGVRDADGRLQALEGFITDITERKRAEEALRESENRLILALSGAQMSVWEWNLQTNQILWSREIFEITGVRENDLGGTFESFTHLIHRDDIAQVMAAAQKAMSEGILFAEEFRIIRPDGKVRWLSNLGHAEYDATRDHLRLIGTVQDITQRKQAEIERQALLEIMQGFAITKDLDELLKHIHHSIAKVIHAENFFVVLYQPNPGLFEEIYSVDRYDLPEPPSRLENSLASYVFHSGEPLLLTQAQFDEMAAQHDVKLIGTQSASWLGVPLKTFDRTIGVMAVQDYENPDRYSERDRDFMASIATQVALAIEHKEAGRALRESEEHYRAIFEGVQDAIFVESLDGRILMVNERACEMFGYSRAEFLTKTVPDIVPQGYPILAADEIDSIVAAKPRETFNQRANGEIFPIEISGRLQVINGERMLLVVIRDITERKRAQEALHTSETHYRELANSITDILFETDQDIRYTHWNRASEIFSGIPAEYAIGKSMRELFGASEEQSRREEIYKSVLQEQQARTFETQVLAKGQKRSLEINAYPSTRGVSVVAKDITERKRAETIMQKRLELMEYSASHTLNELMQRTVDEVSELTGSTFGFFHFVEADQISLGMQTWSSSARQLFKLPPGEGMHPSLDQAGMWAEAAGQRRSLIQNDCQSLSRELGLPADHVPVLREIVIPIIRNERVMAILGVGNKPQDYTPYDLEVAEHLADYAWDIIERKQMEVALEAERNQLARRVEERTADLSRANANLARALRVKDEFLANMSHELRTPLNAILGLSESLAEQIAGPLNEKQQKYITTISESGHHLLSLINDILDLAKIEAGQITLDINKVDIHSVCQASLRMIKQLAQKKNQEVSLEIDHGLGLIWADERRLKQMIVNLLGNAVKFTAEYGKLGLEVHGDREANTITITVWDNGIGIREEDLARLFQPFVQLNSGLAREATGTGLGLALVVQMARLHGGSVCAVSEPEKGSRFSIVLPWEPALAMEIATRMGSTGRQHAVQLDKANQPTILLVEDTQGVTMMISDYLELAGYKVVTVQDGMDGLTQARRVRPDLILMDIQLPRMDGLEVTRKLRAEPDFRYTPIIALTALAMPSDRERCLAAGMDEYISKPIHLKALIKVIEGFLFHHEESRPR